MNKNLTKKALVPAIAMVVASVIALSGVTYAWFTTGTSASVETLEVNVQVAKGIQVSLDAESWKSVISVEDIQEAIDNPTSSSLVIQLPTGEVAPVSTSGNVDANGMLEMFRGEYGADGNLVSSKENDQHGNGGHYIALDLYFKTSAAQALSLKLGTTDDSSNVKCIALDNNASANVNTHTAVRVAFLPMGSVADDKPADARALNTLVDGVDKALIWEPNSKIRANGTEATKLDYKGFKSEFESVAESALAPTAADSEYAEAVTTFDATTEIVNLEAGINKVRVYIWLEGQDKDCVNNISNGDFAVNLYFTVPETNGNA